VIRPFHRFRPAIVTTATLASVLLSAGAAMAGQPTPGGDGAGDPYYPTDGNGGYHASDYMVSISYDPASHHLDGDTTVTATATQDLSSFNLDLTGLTVSAVTVNGQPATFTRTGAHELVITPAAALNSGARFTTEVRYAGVPTAATGNGWTYSTTGGAFAAGEPHSAATWYPVNDTPTDKASFHLSARVPTGWAVISNGLEGSTTTEAGWTTFHWDETTPVAPYLTTVGIDKWTLQRSTLADGTPVVDAYGSGTDNERTNEARLPEILDFLSSKFGKYPQDAAGGIFVAAQVGFSLEIQTRPIYSPNVGLSTLVHENAHQWWGDAVSVNHWADICLNECFASYAQWLWSEAKEGVNLDDRYRQRVTAMRNTPGYWAGKLYDMGPGNEFTAVYDKGQLALHALRRMIGEDAFSTVLKQWPAAHHAGNASWSDFEKYVGQVAGVNLDGFFQEWFHGTTIPEDKYLFPGQLHA